MQDKELPRTIDSQGKEDIIRRFAEHWHHGDARSIKLMFGLEAGEDLVDALKRWKSSLGDVVEGVYSHHQHVRPAGDQDLFHLFYSVRFETDEGMVIVQVRCNEGSYKLVGFGVPASRDN